MGDANFFSSLSSHIKTNFPNSKIEFFTWSLGAINENVPEFRVVRVSPRNSSEPWIYLTLGACQVTSLEAGMQEFFIISPYETPRHVETLAMLVDYYFHNPEKVHLGSSVDIGHEWVVGSRFHRLLVSLPYPYGPDLENCFFSDQVKAKYRWLLPITDEEHLFLIEKGVDPLEQKFDSQGIDFLDPTRNSVV